MYISKILLSNFRNIENLDLDFHPRVNILYGDNGQGKTNLIESIYICAMGRSSRASRDKELIMWDKNESHIRAFVKKDKSAEKIDIHIKKEEKKGIAVNGIHLKKLGELFGTVQTVMFSPEDLYIVKGGPSERRKFIDMEMCQVSNLYYYDLTQYYKVLKHRNYLLKNIQKDKKQLESLFIWDDQLVKYGIKLINQRDEFVKKISLIANEKHSLITSGKEYLKILYKKNVSENELELKIKNSHEKDILSGVTSYGPHKDDLIFLIDDMDIRIFGSQGQKKCAALSAKLAEIDMIKEETGYFPVLLLDDVLSEIDSTRQAFLMESIKDLQTFITCCKIENVIKKNINDSFNFYVEKGKFFNRPAEYNDF